MLTSKEEQVRRIGEFLDKFRPEWFKNIDLSKLQMASWRDCLLGQMFGDYLSGLVIINYNFYDGLEVPINIFGDDYQEEWEDYILQRRFDALKEYQELSEVIGG